jgi:putative protease
VRNLSALAWLRENAPQADLVGDFPLNAANEISADAFARWGLARIAPSCDLNRQQLQELLGRVAPELFEVVIHQHMPMFHTQYCVMASCMAGPVVKRSAYYRAGARDSTGLAESSTVVGKSCGRPCRAHRIELRDRVGAAHPVSSDAGCRVTIFNAVAQSGAEFVAAMKQWGIRHFRVEFLYETSAEVKALLDSYGRLLAGTDDGRETWRKLQKLCPVTRGAWHGA